MATVKLHTNFGIITLDIDEKNTPITASNFLSYVKEKFYDNTIFHRVIKGFVIQGGGFDLKMEQKETKDFIENEADKGEKNKAFSIAMARTNDPHSASSQFFINLKDNDFLNFKSKAYEEFGYCVFGKVTEGSDVVEKIANVETTDKYGHQDVPKENVILEKAEIV